MLMKKKAIKYLAKHFQGDIKGKTIIITGSNAGIGYQAAEYCAYLGMKVILACRSLERGQTAVDALKSSFPDSDISLMQLDVSEKGSIINFVKEIEDKKIDIDVFYHNAGIYNFPYQLKEELDLTLSTNYFGPYMLTCMLLPYLKSLNHEVKLVITSSIAAKYSRNTVDILIPNEGSGNMSRYGASKLLDAHLFNYLNKHDGSNIKYYLVHPGVSGTSLFSKAYKSKFFIKIVDGFMKIFANPLWKSGLSIIPVLSSDNKRGAFYGPTHMLGSRGYPKENHFLDKKYEISDEIIAKTEIITSYKLLK